MINVVDKAVRAARDAGVEEDNFMVCERGTSLVTTIWLVICVALRS